MVLDRRLPRTVVALDDCPCIGELLRHGLTLNRRRQLAPLQVHLHSAFLADWTLVCSFHVQRVALLVHVVPAWHRDNSRGRGEEIVGAYRTARIGSARYAYVRVCMGYGNADIASLYDVRIESNFLLVELT